VILAETAFWEIEKNSQIFNEDFYLPLYLPLWFDGAKNGDNDSSSGAT
jgi:hypothetical protein